MHFDSTAPKGLKTLSNNEKIIMIIMIIIIIK